MARKSRAHQPPPVQRQGGRRSSGKRNRVRKGVLLWGGVLAVIVGIVVYGISSTGLLWGPKGSTEPAPDLVLADTSGQQFRLSEHDGQPRLLWFSFPG